MLLFYKVKEVEKMLKKLKTKEQIYLLFVYLTIVIFIINVRIICYQTDMNQECNS